jgi:hypothetical protein
MAYGVVVEMLWFHVYSTSALDGVEWLTTCLVRSIPVEERGWVGPRARLYGVEKKKTLLSLPVVEFRFLSRPARSIVAIGLPTELQSVLLFVMKILM